MGTCCCNQSYQGRLSEPLLGSGADNTGYKSSKSNSANLSKLNNRLNKQLQRDHERDRRTKKLLLLGPGNSGKSTFFKQLIRIHGKGLSDLKKQYFGQSDMVRVLQLNFTFPLSLNLLLCIFPLYTIAMSLRDFSVHFLSLRNVLFTTM